MGCGCCGLGVGEGDQLSSSVGVGAGVSVADPGTVGAGSKPVVGIIGWGSGVALNAVLGSGALGDGDGTAVGVPAGTCAWAVWLADKIWGADWPTSPLSLSNSSWTMSL